MADGDDEWLYSGNEVTIHVLPPAEPEYPANPEDTEYPNTLTGHEPCCKKIAAALRRQESQDHRPLSGKFR